jgi:hypothetical protein
MIYEEWKNLPVNVNPRTWRTCPCTTSASERPITSEDVARIVQIMRSSPPQYRLYLEEVAGLPTKYIQVDQFKPYAQFRNMVPTRND